MEINATEEQLSVARRGHKLLKDNADELMRQFISTVKHNQELRAEVENLLKQYNQEMVLARAVMPEQVIEQLSFPDMIINLAIQKKKSDECSSSGVFCL